MPHDNQYVSFQRALPFWYVKYTDVCYSELQDARVLVLAEAG